MTTDIPEFGHGHPGITYRLRPGGYAVILNHARQIAIVSTPSGFVLPGGGQNDNESPHDAAIREAHEECGLLIKPGHAIGLADELVFAAGEQVHYRKRCTFFLAEVIGQQGTGESDHELIWLSPQEAMGKLLYESQRWAVSNAILIPPDKRYFELACIWEATIPKPGNVHPGASFSDTTYMDFVASAKAIGPVFEHAAQLSVGELILQAVQATKQTVGKNTNLGIILVLAPLAKGNDQAGVQQVLQSLTVHDAERVYEAIRLASPAGLGESTEQDVKDRPTVTLLEAMRLGAERDLIARQYSNGFAEVFGFLLPLLEQSLTVMTQNQAIQYTFLRGLSSLGDTLIARKCGLALMNETKLRAQQVIDAGWPGSEPGQRAFVELDAWLRADGHRRNPGTMADLIAGTIYLALKNGSLAGVPSA